MMKCSPCVCGGTKSRSGFHMKRTPHPYPYLRRYYHVLAVRMFWEPNLRIPIPRTDNQCVPDFRVCCPLLPCLFINRDTPTCPLAYSLDFLTLFPGISYSKRVSRQELRRTPFKSLIPVPNSPSFPSYTILSWGK